MLRETSLPLCSAEILLILRDHVSITKRDLFQQVTSSHSDVQKHSPRYRRALNHFLTRFEAVGLITSSDEILQVDQQKIEDVQRALDVSLVELARARPGSIVATPRFRSTEESDEIKDVFIAASIMASATSHTCRLRDGVTRGVIPH